MIGEVVDWRVFTMSVALLTAFESRFSALTGLPRTRRDKPMKKAKKETMRENCMAAE